MSTPLHAFLNIRGIPDHIEKGRDIMNIFEKRESFLGCFEQEHTKNSIQNLFKLANEIRTKLGRQGYLLDSYLSLVLEAANNTMAYEATSEGFETASQLQELCFDVMDGNNVQKDHPFYQAVKQSFEGQFYTYQERFTVMSLHCVSLADAFLEYATQLFLKEQDEKLSIVLDDLKLCELYKKITHIIGEGLMENLNLILRQRFFIAPVVAGFMQGLTNDLLYCLIHRDNETSRQIFQLLMDNLPKEH